MKSRFTTLDICAILPEINERVVGMRIVNVYDIDNKTYLFKFAKPEHKAMLLVESGIRMHLSDYDWPKNNMPSSFSMKLRKHLRGRRLIYAKQLGIDRIIDLQFGSDDAAYHVIVELYDRGNIALTDCNYVILNLLRFRKDQLNKMETAAKDENDDVRVVVHEPYPKHNARPLEPLLSLERFKEIIENAKKDSLVKRVLNPHLPYGAPCIDHCLTVAGYSPNIKIGNAFTSEDTEKLHLAFNDAENFLYQARTDISKGYLIQKVEKKSEGELLTNVEFHPFLFEQHKTQPYRELATFNKAVDEFFGSLEAQKLDMKSLQRERQAMKKLENVKRDHEQRLVGLRKEQDVDKQKAFLIENNLELVDRAISLVCGAIANQVDWAEICSLVQQAQIRGDPVAMAIKSLKLESNTITMALSETKYESSDESDFLDSSDDESAKSNKLKVVTKPVRVDINLSLSAYANAQKYYSKKRQASNKEQRTIDAATKAFKSAEKKTKQTLKEAAAIQNIQKARKVFWFEKFIWFISSENYLILGGRDAQQNEILVKKYLIPGDVYVHADLHGATSCVIKNPNSGEPIPPKTLNEAGTMAICHSAAWDAKVVTSAWWVQHHQVSKTAPSGEYLTTGSFLIRGKKNYLPPSYLVFGFGFLFKVDETCLWKHKGERAIKSTNDDMSTVNGGSEHSDIDITDDEDGEIEKNLDGGEINNGAEQQENQQHNDSETIKIKQQDEPQTNENGVKQEDISVKHEPLIEDYPDTRVTIEFDKKYQLDTTEHKVDENEGFVDLGDGKLIPINPNKLDVSQQHKQKLSAKQRRELKKVKIGDGEEIQPNETKSPTPKEEKVVTDTQTTTYKRGQKNKLKKIKEKYKDQDEEERNFRMEILQSGNAPKPKGKKGKKEKKKQEQSKLVQPKEVAVEKQTSEKRTEKKQKVVTEQGEGQGSDDERDHVLKEEHLPTNQDDISLIDSLTGCPVSDDVLLFAIPVCAPYNTMQNYKFKVKLTPGGGKKGKAAKTALGMFQMSRDTTQQEKDHLRSVKDHDLSRNMPGKVKVSAPNLQKVKHRGKK